MWLMIACAALVILGLILIVRWGGFELSGPPPSEGDADVAPPPGLSLQHYLWYVTLVVGAGTGAGILMAGAGGRLAMRLLAVTAGSDAQGRVTEADEVVGRITFGGTVGFVIFTGIFFGLVIGLMYLLIARWLPKGRSGGVVFGALLLVLFGANLDPLRSENPDFDIVGPGWVAVLAVGALVIAHGMLVAAMAGRYSRTLPLLSSERETIVAHAPLLILVPGFPLLALLALGAPVAYGLSRIPALGRAMDSPRTLLVGRIIGLVAIAVALPSFVSAIVDIASRT